MVFRAFKDIKSKYFKKYELVISPQKDKKVNFMLLIYDCKPSIDEKIVQVYQQVSEKLNLELEHIRSGGKKQHYKIVHVHQFNNFDNELKSMQQLCNTFCTEMVSALGLLAD